MPPDRRNLQGQDMRRMRACLFRCRFGSARDGASYPLPRGQSNGLKRQHPSSRPHGPVRPTPTASSPGCVAPGHRGVSCCRRCADLDSPRARGRDSPRAAPVRSAALAARPLSRRTTHLGLTLCSHAHGSGGNTLSRHLLRTPESHVCLKTPGQGSEGLSDSSTRRAVRLTTGAVK